jgi:N-acyl homoserine lactone hydrolase
MFVLFGAVAQRPPESQEEAHMASARLFIFQCGTIRLKMHGIRKDQGGDALIDVPVPWFVIEHPAGNIIIDGGNAAAVATNARDYWGPIAEACVPTMKESEFCVSAMEAVGLKPTDIRYVFLSHLHHDHTGAIGQFGDAVHVVRRREYEYAFAPDWFVAPAYVRKDFDKANLRWEFLGDDLIDFYGDGSIRLVATPGHSPGHQSFFVNAGQSGALLLAVDAVPTRDHWERHAQLGLTTSMSDAVRSIEKLRGLADRSYATLVPGHDPDAWPNFKLAPQAYA